MLKFRRLLWKFNHSLVPLYIMSLLVLFGFFYLVYSQDAALQAAQVSDCKNAGGDLKRVGISGSKVIRRCIDDFGREMPY